MWSYLDLTRPELFAGVTARNVLQAAAVRAYLSGSVSGKLTHLGSTGLHE